MTSRPVLAALAALVAAVAMAGCVSVPTGGPVTSAPVTQGPSAQSQPYVQIVPPPPGAGWLPAQIVQGFLTASASFGNNSQVALEYLTAKEQKSWDPSWSAIVYKNGPTVSGVTYSSPVVKKQTTATVQITGTVAASLKGYGSYSVPSASAPSESSIARQEFKLVKAAGGQWRISSAPNELLLTSNSFANDYQLRNLYFLDPMSKFLVPDPVYVPLRSKPGDLMNGLVHDLITPPKDWLSAGATKTAFPPATKIGGVTINGVTAVVNLTGATITKASTGTRAGTGIMQQVSAQLLWTLSGAAQNGSTGQAVQSVQVEVNGKPWIPSGSQGNPVQRQSASELKPAPGASPVFYYVDKAGYLTSRDAARGKPARIAKIGTEYSQVAVSPDGRYLAALHGDTLYTGLIGKALDKRGSGYLTMSWDDNDDLWASQGEQIVMFRGEPGLREPLGQQVPVDVMSSSGTNNLSVPFTALRVAPDGVRVAIAIGGTVLSFGAISGLQGASPRITLSPIQVAPADAIITGLTWYGPDNVITLTEPGPAVTEYPVSGGAPTSIPAYPGMETISATAGNLLITGLPKGHMLADASLTGSWMEIGDGSAAAYPG